MSRFARFADSLGGQYCTPLSAFVPFLLPPLTRLFSAVTLVPLLRLLQIIAYNKKSVKEGVSHDIDAETAVDIAYHRCSGLCPRVAGGTGRYQPADRRDSVWREFLMRKAAKEKRVRTVPIWMGILVFALAFGAGVASKFVIFTAGLRKVRLLV